MCSTWLPRKCRRCGNGNSSYDVNLFAHDGKRLNKDETISTAATPEKRSVGTLPALYMLLLLGGLARLLVWVLFAGSPEHIADAQDYDRLAVGLAETGRYITKSGDLSSLRPPFYPWCVSLGYRLFGVGNYEAIRLFQAALSLVTVALVYRLGSMLFEPRVGLLAAALYCFYPSALGFNNLILSETLFTFLVTLSVWMLAKAFHESGEGKSLSKFHRPSVGWLIGAGFVLGLGALTRSILWLFMPVLAIAWLVFGPSPWLRRYVGGALMVTTFLLTIAPWAYRNTQVQETTTIIDVMGGRNVMMGNYEYTPLERSWATIDTVTGEQSWISVLIREHGPIKGLTQGQIDKLAMKHGISFMLANPGLTMQRSLVRFFNFWQLDRTLVAGLREGYWLKASAPVVGLFAVGIMGYYAILAFTGIFGVVFAEPRDWRLHGLLLLNIAFPCAVHSAIFAHARYHVPLIPLICIYSAFALASWRHIWLARFKARFWIAAAICLILALAWMREIIVVDMSLLSRQV